MRVLAYFPQIVRICRDNDGAAAISYWMWGLFGISLLSTVAYALTVLGDASLALIFGANAVCCAAIIMLTAYKRAAVARSLVN